MPAAREVLGEAKMGLREGRGGRESWVSMSAGGSVRSVGTYLVIFEASTAVCSGKVGRGLTAIVLVLSACWSLRRAWEALSEESSSKLMLPFLAPLGDRPDDMMLRGEREGRASVVPVSAAGAAYSAAGLAMAAELEPRWVTAGDSATELTALTAAPIVRALLASTDCAACRLPLR